MGKRLFLAFLNVWYALQLSALRATEIEKFNNCKYAINLNILIKQPKIVLKQQLYIMLCQRNEPGYTTACRHSSDSTMLLLILLLTSTRYFQN